MKMTKESKIKEMIAEDMVIEASSPWDGVARFDNYSVVVHKYDNEDLAFLERSDWRYAQAAERIFKLINPIDWDRLIEDYSRVDAAPTPRGERNATPRGRR